MQRLRIQGGARLAGEVGVAGAKNSALKLMAAALLAEGTTVLHNVPDILDVTYMCRLLERLGCAVELVPVAGADGADGAVAGALRIGVPARVQHEADYDLVRRLRASIAVLGPLVARCGRARVALPGGDAIGSRGLSMHIAGLERLGAELRVEHGFVVAEAPTGLHGAAIALEFPSVGATENLMTAAVLAEGTTILENVAREPEIVDLAEFLSGMGAKIGGIGTSVLEIEGQAGLSATEHTTVPDRMVTGTWAVGAAMSRGDVFVRDGRAEHLEMVLDKLTDAGAVVEPDPSGLRVRMTERPKAVDIVTLPYPGFPTDLQPPMVALAAISEGTSVVTENLYDGRFGFVQELARLGADCRTDGHHAVVRGVPGLSGAPVDSPDIRAGAALMLAGVVAEGETLVSGVAHLDRGYPKVEQALAALGVTATRDHSDDPDD